MSIENLPEENRDEAPPDSETFVIELGWLPLFEQAAEQTGYQVSVIAQKGEPYTFWYDNLYHKWDNEGHTAGSLQKERVYKTIVIRPDYVAISIVKPLGQRNHNPFWDAYVALKPTF